jgi:hypothetical protein
MSSRIILGKILDADEFTRYNDFSAERPYVLIIRKFVKDYISIPHYVDYLELLVCENLEGEVIIDNRHFQLKNSQIYYIPPHAVHFISICKGKGNLYVLKVSLEHLALFFNIDQLCLLAGLDFLTS